MFNRANLPKIFRNPTAAAEWLPPQSKEKRIVVLATWPGQEVAGCYEALQPHGTIHQIVYAFHDNRFSKTSNLTAAALIADRFGCDVEFLDPGCYESANFCTQVGAYLMDTNSTLLVPSIQNSCPYAQSLNRAVRKAVYDRTRNGQALFYAGGLDAIKHLNAKPLEASKRAAKLHHLINVMAAYAQDNAHNNHMHDSEFPFMEFESLTQHDTVHLDIEQIGSFLVESDSLAFVRQFMDRTREPDAHDLMNTAIQGGSRYTRIQSMPRVSNDGSGTIALHRPFSILHKL